MGFWPIRAHAGSYLYFKSWWCIKHFIFFFYYVPYSHCGSVSNSYIEYNLFIQCLTELLPVILLRVKTLVVSYLRASIIQNRIEKFGSLRFAAFQTSLWCNTFAKWPHLHKPNFNLKITVKSVSSQPRWFLRERKCFINEKDWFLVNKIEGK